MIFLCMAVMLAGCSTYPIQVRNIPSTSFGQTLSSQPIHVTYDGTLEAYKGRPTRHLYRIDQPVLYDGRLLIPVGSILSCYELYQDTPNRVIDFIQMVHETDWTPAQGVIVVKTNTTGIATLTQVMIPNRVLRLLWGELPQQPVPPPGPSKDITPQ